MKVCLSLDDFSVVNNRLDLLLDLKEYYPGFKVSLFTVPFDSKEDWGAYLLRKEFLEKIKANLDWLQIIPHGLIHDGSEMRRCEYDEFRYEIMPKIKQAFDRDGLPFVKGFKAPHWRWTQGVVKALDDEGWWGAIDRRQPYMPSPKRFYKYSHCIDEPLDLNLDVLKLHGHVYGTSNDLYKCMGNIFKIPKDAEWHFVTDFIEDKV